jgi:aryl-alcohol dehydrogenase-like predicted oxidoreductase
MALRVPYSLLQRDIEHELLPMAEAFCMTSPPGHRWQWASSPAQVAIAWTITRSAGVHPIVGARRADQLADNLGAVDVELPPEARVRLDKATGFRHWFPTTFIQRTDADVGRRLPRAREGAPGPTAAVPTT